jgi:hypothetical protein
MPAEAFRSRVAHAAAAPAVPPGAAVEPAVPPGADDADAAPVGLDAAEDAEADTDAEAEGAVGDEPLLGDEEELQPAASAAARSATPVNSPRWVRADGVIQMILSMIPISTF